MNKRIISIVLCVTMLMSFFVPAVSAAEDNIVYIDNTVVEEGNVVAETVAPTTAATEPAETEAVTVPVETEAVTESTEADEAEDPVSAIADCDCGGPASLVATHADRCALKQFCKDLCAGTASEIYALWNQIPKGAQAYVLTYLGYKAPATLEELVFLLGSDWENESGLSGVASAIKDGTLFGAFGIPEDAALQIKEAAAEAKAAIEAFLSKQGDDLKELFTWDISVLDGEGINWQPDGSVRLELEIPGENLHKHSKVYVVHVDDEGNAEKIEAEVIDGNKIAFNTNGFSTFAAFTVDFEYDGVPFSIPGMSSILLSELMDKLEMPFDVEEVADVAFTNYDLISVEKQGSDWKLTSLQAFTSNEILTLTMNNGKVYEIKVTDATYVTISYNNSGNQDSGTLGVVEWYLHDSRYGGQAYSGADSNSAAPGWTEDYDIYIDGTGATNKNFEIVLQRHNYAQGRTLYVDLHTVWIKGGANLTFRLGASITKENTDQIIIRQVRGYRNDTSSSSWWFGELFWVENGSLNLQVPYAQAGGVHEGVKMVFDWDSDNNNNPSGNSPKALVSLRYHATSFKANQCVFRNTQDAAIVCRANDMDTFIMTDCEFTNTSKPGGNGAGIYVMSNTADSAGDYVDIHRFELNNCKFTNSVGGGYGGAVALFGYVHSGLISGCTFTNCQSTEQGGGALELAGSMGAFTIQNSKFSGCTSKYRGGAIEIRSTDIKNSSDQERWTRSNAITISGCTFENCSSADSHGGAIAVKAQLHTFSVSGSSFTNCVAGINGGAISIDGQDLPDTFANTGDSNPNWTAAISCSDCVSKYKSVGTTMSGSYNWFSNEDKSKTIDKKSVVGTVNITDGCSFLNCSCASNGGTIEFASGMYITESATISDAIIDGGKAVGGGSAIFTSNCIIKKLNLHDDIFRNCDFNPGADDVGGTVRTTGQTTIVLDVQRCQFLNNKSYGHAGGIYWNAARSLDGITCEATVNDCLFEGNEVGMYGGAIYVESKMTITKCHIKNNTAGQMGGGIAQQVYNNPDVRMLQDGDVSELKLDPNTWIHDNTAPLGGGISIRANETDAIEDGKPINLTVRFELNGAAVYQNQAIKDANGDGGHGGGIYFIAETCSDPQKQAEVDKYTKVILINQGTGTAAAVYNNTAAGNGGGIYMESSENTELRVQGGFISTNTGVNGGGIYMTGKNATCYVEGGTIGGEGNDSKGNPLANHANKAADGTGGNGGGIAISGGAKIEMTGGTISYNTAAVDGGGIYLDRRSDNKISNVFTIDGGSIIHNSAGSNGGGVAMLDFSNATLNGGNVSYNTAVGNGGGIYSYIYANVTVSGGTIESNTASTGSGGGVHSAWYGLTKIEKTSTIKGNKALNGAGGGVFAHKNNVQITGGEITENQAKNGGGVCIVSSPDAGYTTSISGGSIYKNTATRVNGSGGGGGGIYNQGCAHLTVSGGDIYENKAYNGGGIYSDIGGTTKISSGDIYSNTASNRGGGVFLSAANINIEGGSIYSNHGPYSGGGLCVMSSGSSGSTVTMSGGDIYGNTASAGWGAGIYMWGQNSSVNVSGGNIYENTASGCGGGINAEYHSSVTINGGNIYKNTAGMNGGGIQIYNSASATISGGAIYMNTAVNGGGVHVQAETNFDSATNQPIYGSTVTIEGGSIYENTANGTGTDNGQGGGIFANGFANVIVRQSADGKTAGKITKNTASKGGGVYVADGAKLEVINGFIIENNAVTPEGVTNTFTTTYLKNDGLYGVGGGVYVADGYVKNDDTTGAAVIVPSYFHLSGDNIAIYGNIADFAADDVFSNANNTKLDVPQVQNMNLAGYDMKPEGWVEDYCIADTQYEIGTESVLNTNKFVNGNNNGTVETNENVRYRQATRFQRIVISDDKVAAAINPSDAFICMTLGIPSALPEKVGYSFYLVDENGNFLNEKGEVVDDISEAYKVIDPKYDTVTGDSYEVVGKEAFTDAGLDDQYTMYDPNATYEATYNEEKGDKTYNYWETSDDKDTTYVTTDGGKTYSNEETSFDPDKPDADMQESVVYFPVIAPKVGYSFYLVDEDGKPINANGEIADNFADSKKILDPIYQYVIGNGTTLGAQDVYGKSDLSDLYELYSPDASYELIFDKQHGENTYNYWETNDVKDSTYVTTDDGKNYSHAETNFDETKPDAELYKSLVYYAVRLKEKAVEDIVVIDFGLSVNINLLGNDSVSTGTKVLGIKQSDVVPSAGTNPGDEFEKADSVVNGAYGFAVLNSDNTVTYTITDMKMVDTDVFTYVVQDATTGYYYYAKVTVVPATSIYFEDNFQNGKQDYVTFKTYTYTEGERNATPVDSQWTSVGSAMAKSQNEDRPGALSTNDANNIYGYDSNYNDSSIQSYSMGSAMKFTAKQNGTTKTYGTASFAFTGTGFDIISLTSRDTGTVMVEVKQGDSVVKQSVVNTYYGYKYENGKWVVDNEVKDTLYQVPVIKVDGLTYGTYTVTLTVTYNVYFDYKYETGDEKSYDFYLDAIRIYDPANNGDSNKVIQDAYVADKEGWPAYHELRNLILDPNMDGTIADDTKIEGVVFIDNSAAGSDFKPTLSQYLSYGPNNEVYLADGQTIAFTFTPDANMAAAHVALRSSQYMSSFKISTTDGKSITKTVYGSNVYFDISSLLLDENGAFTTKTVTIQCVDSAWDAAVLVISDVKITHKAAPAAGSDIVPFSVSRRTVNEVLEYLANQGEIDPSEPVVNGGFSILGASLSFEDEILTNLYFTSDLDNVAAEDMGLLTWNAMPGNATVENAENVFAGAAYDAENGRYMVQTSGIAAKNLGDDIYMCVYAKLADGNYVYSDVITYSPKTYAMSRLEKSESESLKALCVAMLNYGAAAQNYFGYKTGDLMNAGLTAEQQALVSAYDADLFNGAIAADSSKVGAFAKSENGFKALSASVSFEGAFAINYYFATDAAVDGEVKFYFWNSEDYANAEVLTADNASGEAVMVDNGNGAYWAQVSGIAAKEMDETYYVAAVYSSNGETYCTGVIAYSLSTYCVKNAANGSVMQDLAQATAVYGYHADAYFNMEG